MSASRDSAERLDAFARLVRRWNPRINLVAPASLAALETRHIADSLQLIEGAPEGVWADLGSGGGFPGIVVAIARPGPVHLIESDARKAAFLRTAIRELGLDATVHAARAEALPPLGARVVSARALAPLPRLLPLVARHLAPGGTAILPKGRHAMEEIDTARADWNFRESTRPSITDPDARVVTIKDLQRRDR
ncbi:MAG: 16S rRNA (guanine(527)-N(7))-methyltransferase RsmG [Paracoccaceae bacterium]